MPDRLLMLAGAAHAFAAALSCAVALALVLTSAALAQRVVSVDVGAARVRYADTLSTATLAVSPTLQIQSPRAALRASGTLSQLGSGGWTTQGALVADLYSPNLGPLLGEVSSSMGGSAHRDGTRTGQLLGVARAHLVGARVGAWAGAGAGSTWDGDVWRSVRQAELGAWARSVGRSALLTATPTVVDDTIEYIDAALALGWETRAIELSAIAGYRSGDRLPVLGGTDQAWGSISIVAWLTPWAGVVAGAGTYPVDLTQGFPGGRFLTLGMRFSPRRRSLPIAEPFTENGTAAARDATSPSAIAAFEAMPAADGLYTLRVRAPRASRVEVNADFTDWQPLHLTAVGAGWWSTTLHIARGAHQMNARIDGGPWLVPPGLAAVADEFGGSVGILVVTR